MVMKNRHKFTLLKMLGLAVALTIGDAVINQCLATSLKQQAVVKDDVVRLSDLFHDAGRHGERVVLQSPDPGRRMVLNAKWLYRTARSFRLKWKPLSAMDHVVVERATHYISTEQIQETLGAGIRSELEISDKFEIAFDNRLLQMYLPGEALPTVEIQTLRIDRQTNRFSAIMVGAGGRHRGSRITVTGKYYRIIDVPVLVRRMSSNEIISPQDIRLVTRRADKVDMNGLRDASELIGMSPLRTLSADRPVKRSEIRKPVLIGKGSIVTMMFRSERMMLTAQGADHTVGNAPSFKCDDKTIDELVAESLRMQINSAVADSFGLCVFGRSVTDDNLKLIADAINDSFDADVTPEFITGIGFETLRLEAAFNKAAGFDQEDDELPSFFCDEPLPPTGKMARLYSREVNAAMQNLMEAQSC